MKVTIRRYKRSRHWAVYINGKLLAVTVYRQGAVEVKQLVEWLMPPDGDKRVTRSEGRADANR